MSYHAFRTFSLESTCYHKYAKKQLNSYNFSSLNGAVVNKPFCSGRVTFKAAHHNRYADAETTGVA
ncbi:hypothetical protein LCGC14_2164990, partial [marine sediment metagenome]